MWIIRPVQLPMHGRRARPLCPTASSLLPPPKPLLKGKGPSPATTHISGPAGRRSLAWGPMPDRVSRARTAPSPARSASQSSPDVMAELDSEERASVALFQDNIKSVVNVNTTVAAGAFLLSGIQVPQGVGSGFIWDTKGRVVTNAHVISGTTSRNGTISITLWDGSVAKAKVIGKDDKKDVAVLQLDLKPEVMSELRPIQQGCSSNLLVGQKVYALGNPFGLDQSLSQGIVSGLGRDIGPSSQTVISNAIQTDAAINPGNSGGPLLDSKGRLVGINTAIVDPTGFGISSGVGFAIPIDVVKGMVQQLIELGRVVRPAIGITIAPIPWSLALMRRGARLQKERDNERAKKEEEGSDADGGVLVMDVRSGGPADVAGVQPTRRDMFGNVSIGDIIQSVNGKPIKRQRDLFTMLDAYKVGDRVTLELETLPRRQDTTAFSRPPSPGGKRTVTVVLADRYKMQWRGE